MLSRIADSLYWMSRHLERAGNTSRLLEINLIYLLEAEDALPVSAQWKPLLAITSTEAAYEKCFGSPEITAHRVVQFMTSERSNPNSIRSSLRLARENARVVRDRISKEMWESMNESWLQFDRQLSAPIEPQRAASLYAAVRDSVARFHGLTSNTMMRGEGWAFYLLGTILERADMTARIARREVPPALAGRQHGRLATRLLSVGGAAEVAVGLRGVPPQVPGRHAAGRRGRVCDLRARLSAVAGASRSIAWRRPCARSGRETPRGRRVRRWAACARRCTRRRRKTSFTAGCTNSSKSFSN